jgi:lipopolysaccharide/colanic/teichoic acid biosynthesis glycosyltransferase
MVLMRALALSTGLIIGALRPPRPVAPDQWMPLTLWQRLVKRTLDVITAAVGLIVSSPILLIAGLAIRLDSPGPVFFVQERVGQDGRQFGMLKLRTMVADAEARLEEVLAQNPLSGPAFKIPDDQRVTRVGRFLRRWSLDELPQLWNIIRGEMSLVGPRPEEERVVEQYQDWHRKRLAVKPGLTGPMQIAGRGLLELDERVHMELEYIEGYSFWRDLGILFKTIPAVFSGKGAL